MVTHIRGLLPGRRTNAVVMALGTMAVLSFASGCDKVPLLAPTGTVITLFPAATNVPLNGEVEIVATVIENGTAAATPTPAATPGATSSAGAGTPVQNGTVISFTSTIGRIEPSEARTNNGQVRVKFISSGTSGTATITAFSGGASATLKDLLVGSAAAKRVTLSASPQTLSSAGGTAAISARVEDEAGTSLPGVPVTFTTSAGTLSVTSTTTDSSGVARTALTSSIQADVTATVGAQSGKVTVGVAAKSGLTVSASPQAATVGTPVSFTITAAATANLIDGRIDYGDGSSRTLGTLGTNRSDSHVYDAAGNYNVTVTARDASAGGTESAGAAVTIGSLQVTLIASPNPATSGAPVVLTVNGTSSALVREYAWFFDDGTTQPPTGGPATQHVFSTRGIKTVRVDVISLTGARIGSATAIINVQ